ncbi:hypothetical protein Ppa06_37080 [Planomonospora parontospora subsp. parontospora]|uniref:Uncharacterized protein n=2 Tax=Planomonospora parontospora TaxID=58119 RepID=A0AA37BH67_9ACTN|nr:hypothetical protein [Planomonospora parontospora]GGK69690.1 hypothetical protein GCM10010126_31360 [Planomonospora parontospora]GII09910.1 hypothetical protein Ppa06_37080 [Planomonospora parontospora subsp. parontospora]
MSSVLLYLAIVVMWLCVLVPMWLRRDRTTLVEVDERDETTGAYDLAGAPAGNPSQEEGPSGPLMRTAGPAVGSAAPSAAATASAPGAAYRMPAGAATGAVQPEGEGVQGHRRAELRRAAQRRRAALVAKRRRLTLWCALLLLASVVTAAVQVIPWWGVAPSVVLLGVHLAVLRVAVQVDAERRRAAAQARAERARRARRRAAEAAARRAAAPQAEIIDLSEHRDELFDQYAEPSRRAVGD